MATVKKSTNNKCWRKEKSFTVGGKLQADATTMENSIQIPSKLKTELLYIQKSRSWVYIWRKP